MSEAAQARTTFCRQCGGTVDSDARFCKHCAFDLTGDASPIGHPETASRPKRTGLYLICAAGGLVVLAAVVIGLLIFKGRSPQPTPAAAIASPTPTMSDRAQQIEAKILRGESLTEGDIEGLSPYELRVLRNVHFARYGRQYDRPGLGDYFATRPWYKPSSDYKDSMVTATDKGNINLILARESTAGSPPPAANNTSASTVTAAVELTPTPAPSPSGGSELSHEDMRQMILRRGAWDYGFGWVRLTEVEIQRVGEFNEQHKYWPVRVRAIRGDRMFILDYHIYKDDYGDWAVRMVGSI